MACFLWLYTIGKGVLFQFQTHAVTDLFSPRITQLSKSMWEWNLPHGVVPIECYYLSPILFHFLTIYMNSIILRSLISICCRGRVQSNSKPVHILNTIFIIAFNGFFFSKRAKKKPTTNKQNPNIFFYKGNWLLAHWHQSSSLLLVTEKISLFIAYMDKFFYPYVRRCDKARIRLNI